MFAARVRCIAACAIRSAPQVRAPPGLGRDARSLLLLPGRVNASASLSVASSGIRGITDRSSSRLSFLPSASVARPCCYPPTAQGGQAMAWSCPRCTYLNQGGGAVCGMCALDSPEPVVDSGPEWSCRTCTFLNHFVDSSCEMCNTARPELAELERNQLADQGARPTGKFRPLRASHRRNADKERSHEAADSESGPPMSDDVQSSIKEPDVVSRKRKAVAVEDEEGLNTSEMDGLTAAPREKPATGEGEVSNTWLGELHAQRMARINNLASSDLEKSSQQNLGQASGLPSDSSAKGRSETTAAGPCPSVDIDTVVILTYNVWFREDLELQARMNAIGKIIQLHQPHVICLQEVTFNIYTIFQESSWWSLYKCSIAPAVASKRSYFCIQLSRLPVLAFHQNPYNNSIMGRELAMADLDHGQGEQLVVATTHLESPCPAPPTWNQMFSKERVFQANEALKLMKDLPNVIFGGDMNWDDKQDGPPPLPPGWYDAWLKFRPNQPGLTYDSKANPMLGGSRLQKRLDRFFCHLQDFKVKSVEMVGTQAIPGLSYQKERKVKGQVQFTTLPVLPSDHFGLLLQLQRIHT